jgi:DNA invertase Pin-like site-specific DNA recombinase
VIDLSDATDEQLTELINAVVSARLQRGKALARAAGGQWGRYRYGADGSPRATEEQKVIQLVTSLRSDGATWQVVASTLNAQGYRNQDGRMWITSTTRSTLGEAAGLISIRIRTQRKKSTS